MYTKPARAPASNNVTGGLNAGKVTDDGGRLTSVDNGIWGYTLTHDTTIDDQEEKHDATNGDQEENHDASNDNQEEKRESIV